MASVWRSRGKAPPVETGVRSRQAGSPGAGASAGSRSKLGARSERGSMKGRAAAAPHSNVNKASASALRRCFIPSSLRRRVLASGESPYLCGERIPQSCARAGIGERRRRRLEQLRAIGVPMRILLVFLGQGGAVERLRGIARDGAAEPRQPALADEDGDAGRPFLRQIEVELGIALDPHLGGEGL